MARVVVRSQMAPATAGRPAARGSIHSTARPSLAVARRPDPDNACTLRDDAGKVNQGSMATGRWSPRVTDGMALALCS